MTASLSIRVIRSSLVDWRSMKKEGRHARHNSNVADVTCIHYAPSPKVLNFTARLLLRRIISLCAFFYGAYFHSAPSPKVPRVSKRLLLWRSICDYVAIKNIPSSPKALSFIACLLLRRLVSNSFLFIEPKYCKHIIDHTIFIIFSWYQWAYIAKHSHAIVLYSQ